MGIRTARNGYGHYGSSKDTTRTGRHEGGGFKQPLINRIAFVIDASSSMQGRERDVVKVIDNQVTYLARRSKELGQETRVSIASFADAMAWLVYDVDVLRLPSINGLFKPYGNTALVEATIQTQEDLARTPELAGDYSYLTFVVTDGQENVSETADGAQMTGSHLRTMFQDQGDNWTVAVLVPDIQGKREAINYGFPKDNVAVWNTTSVEGFTEVGETITAATESYLTGRASGQRGSRQIFSTGADVVNARTVKSTLQPLAGDKYRLIPVVTTGVKGDKVRVDKFIREDCGMKFQLGTVFYQWNKTEKVQPQKRLAVVEKKTDKVYVGTGDEIRAMIGLPDMSVTQRATPNPDFDVFVQSTAPNRNLLQHTKVLVML
jgi:hypothetical protein